MALAIVRDQVITLGNANLHIIKCTFTGVTGGLIQTGMANVLAAWYSPRTSDDHGIVYPNFSDAGSTASAGDVYVDGVTSGDVGYLMVIGNG